MTKPTPTPKKQNPPATPDSREPGQDENSSTPERDGFFKRVRPGKPHPTEAEEIVIEMPIAKTDEES
jgi:hypothetical protein